MIKTKRTSLLPLEKKDLSKTIKWLNSPDIGVPLGKSYLFSVSGSEKWFDENVTTQKVIIFKILVNNNHVGNVTLDDFALVERLAKFSIYIGKKKFWGKGHAKEASIAMLRYGFGQLNLYKIYLRVFANNKRAIKLYQSIGFKREGILRKEKYISDKYVDVIHMGIFKSEFKFWETYNGL